MKGFRFTSYLRRDTLWRPESVREEVVAGAGHAQSMVRKNQKNGLNPWREGEVARGRRRHDKKSLRGGAIRSDRGVHIFMYKGT